MRSRAECTNIMKSFGAMTRKQVNAAKRFPLASRCMMSTCTQRTGQKARRKWRESHGTDALLARPLMQRTKQKNKHRNRKHLTRICRPPDSFGVFCSAHVLLDKHLQIERSSDHGEGSISVFVVFAPHQNRARCSHLNVNVKCVKYIAHNKCAHDKIGFSSSSSTSSLSILRAENVLFLLLLFIAAVIWFRSNKSYKFHWLASVWIILCGCSCVSQPVCSWIEYRESERQRIKKDVYFVSVVASGVRTERRCTTQNASHKSCTTGERSPASGTNKQIIYCY